MPATDTLSPAAARLEGEYPWATPRELEAFAAANPPALPVARHAADEEETALDPSRDEGTRAA